MVTKYSPVPLYEQVKRIIRSQILDGEFAQGTTLPPEREFCEHFGVSRITVKRALDELAKEGALLRIQGKGTIVRNLALEDNQSMVEGFSQLCRRNGLTPLSHVLSITERGADEMIRGTFGLSDDDTSRFMCFRRLLSASTSPMAVVTSIVPVALGQEMVSMGVEDASFYTLIAHCTGHVVSRSRAIINPIIPTHDVANLLEVGPGTAHFHSRIISFLDTGDPIELSVGVYAADKIQWTAERYELRKEVMDNQHP